MLTGQDGRGTSRLACRSGDGVIIRASGRAVFSPAEEYEKGGGSRSRLVRFGDTYYLNLTGTQKDAQLLPRNVESLDSLGRKGVILPNRAMN